MASLPPIPYQSLGESQSVQPRSLITISFVQFGGGTTSTPVPGMPTYRVVPLTVNIDKHSHGIVHTATVTFPVKSADPNTPPIDWAALITPGIQAKIIISNGFPKNPSPGSYNVNELSQRFIGYVNEIDIEETTSDATWTLTCRSLGAILFDAKMTTNFKGTNTTAFLNQYCATPYGFNTVIKLPPGATASTISEVFKHNQVAGVKNMKVWDILVMCAETDGCITYVDGNTLYYVYPQEVQEANYTIDCNADIISFKGKHSPQFNKNIEVRCHNASPKIRQSHRSKVSSGANGTYVLSSNTSTSVTSQGWGTPTSTGVSTSTSSNGTTSATISDSSTSGGNSSVGTSLSDNSSNKEIYNYYYRNKDQAFIDKEAIRIWKLLSMHEYSVDLEIPLTKPLLDNLQLTSIFALNNAPSSVFSYNPNTQNQQLYRLRQASEKFDLSTGWSVSMSMYNHVLPSNDAETD